MLSSAERYIETPLSVSNLDIPDEAPPPYPGPPVRDPPPPYVRHVWTTPPPGVRFEGEDDGPNARTVMLFAENPFSSHHRDRMPVSDIEEFLYPHGTICPFCRIGNVCTEFTGAGLLVALLFFPFGIICCLFMTRVECDYCEKDFHALAI